MASEPPGPVGLNGLFGDGIATAEVWLHETLGALFPEEEAALGRARPERILEFRAGRHAARCALSALGVAPTGIPRSQDRSPIWPSGVAGSITHVRRRGIGWAAAAAARSDGWCAIGLDAEIDSPLDVALWRRVLTPADRERIASSPEDVQGHLAKLVFSAKECAYKCQYALTQTFLEFSDVEVELSEGSFLAHFAPEPVRRAVGRSLEGRYYRRGGLIVTGAALPRRG